MLESGSCPPSGPPRPDDDRPAGPRHGRDGRRRARCRGRLAPRPPLRPASDRCRLVPTVPVRRRLHQQPRPGPADLPRHPAVPARPDRACRRHRRGAARPAWWRAPSRAISPGAAAGDALASAASPGGSESAGELALVLGLLLALVSMTAAMGQVERGSNRIYGIRRDRKAPAKYGRAAVLTAVLAAPVGLGFLLLVAGGAFAEAMAVEYGWSDDAVQVWRIARWPVGTVLLVLAIAAVLDHAPRRRQPALSWLALGSAVAVLLSMSAAGLLAAYVHVSSSFGSTYGPARRDRRPAAVVADDVGLALLRRGRVRPARGPARGRHGAGRPGPGSPARPRHGRLSPVRLGPWTPRPGTSGTPPPSWSGRPGRTGSSRRSAPTSPPGRALDLAAGEGRNAIWLARRGWQVTAVDFSQVALDKGREVAGDADVDWVRADATTWATDDRVRPGGRGVPPARGVRTTGRDPQCLRLAGAGRHAPRRRPRLQQPDRGVRWPAGRDRPLHRRRRARRPRRRGRSTWSGPSASSARCPRLTGVRQLRSIRSCGWYAGASIAA